MRPLPKYPPPSVSGWQPEWAGAWTPSCPCPPSSYCRRLSRRRCAGNCTSHQLGRMGQPPERSQELARDCTGTSPPQIPRLRSCSSSRHGVAAWAPVCCCSIGCESRSCRSAAGGLRSGDGRTSRWRISHNQWSTPVTTIGMTAHHPVHAVPYHSPVVARMVLHCRCRKCMHQLGSCHLQTPVSLGPSHSAASVCTVLHGPQRVRRKMQRTPMTNLWTSCCLKT
mmetsp:Transcript_105751/g.309329  ORF Transcript_105751/g.309329 Transcript_105751/m.309329 type:complete len:224 (+) Transcript_105751:689-1360(+)